MGHCLGPQNRIRRLTFRRPLDFRPRAAEDGAGAAEYSAESNVCATEYGAHTADSGPVLVPVLQNLLGRE